MGEQILLNVNWLLCQIEFLAAYEFESAIKSDLMHKKYS